MIFTILWITWGVAFFAIEIPAFFATKDGAGTLSAQIWRWAGVRASRGGGWGWQRIVLLLFLCWLLVHLAFGWLSL